MASELEALRARVAELEERRLVEYIRKDAEARAERAEAERDELLEWKKRAKDALSQFERKPGQTHLHLLREVAELASVQCWRASAHDREIEQSARVTELEREIRWALMEYEDDHEAVDREIAEAECEIPAVVIAMNKSRRWSKFVIRRWRYWRERAEEVEAQLAAATEERGRLREALRGLISFRGRPGEWNSALDQLDRYAEEYGEDIPDDFERTMHVKAGALRAARDAFRDAEEGERDGK